LTLSSFTDEARRLVDEANADGITLRVMGATAIKMHCPRFSQLLESMAREISDIDFMALSSDRDRIVQFLLKMGYQFNRRRLMVMRYFGRYIFDDPSNRRVADVFFDQLEMCHTIDFRGRLKVDYPTISLADLLLEKLQIVKITEKDLKDCMVLLREHDVSGSDDDCINNVYISDLLSKDWGFYYTSNLNLTRIAESLKQYSALQESNISDIASKIKALQEQIEKAPKSMGWKMRAKIGPRQQWYRDVEEVERT
jgi:hypothetical protein